MQKTVHILAVILLTALTGCAGTQPANLGITNGKLAPCPESPNCVSSDASDDLHHIEPLLLPGTAQQGWEKLVLIIEDHSRTEIISQNESYIHATFTSRLFRFVDDVEFHLRPEEGSIGVRSASRLGYGDMGANRKRVEFIREKLAQ